MEYRGTVSESLEPTFENVTNQFVTTTMYKLLYSKEIPNFRMRFFEPEAMEFIKQILDKYSKQGKFSERKATEILKGLEEKNDFREEHPVMTINNYREFFEQLRQFYEEQINMFFKRTGFSSFHSYEMVNCFELIWLRATPEDFNDPETFLKKQVQMARDKTFQKYDEEVCLGKMPSLDNNILCIQNKVARIWDESSQEMHITIYDREYYQHKEWFNRPHYTLPVIRYGVFEQDGKKICRIGSIQNKELDEEQTDISKKVNRAKYKVNKGTSEQDRENVEPKNLITLSIFVDLLSREGITDIEVPAMYVLDHEWHKKIGDRMMKEFKSRWPTDNINESDTERYMRERKHLERTYGNQDLISEIKSERFMKTFTRLLQHYPNGEIFSYPTELDSSYHITIPQVKNKSEINGSLLQEMYSLVENQYSDIEI